MPAAADAPSASNQRERPDLPGWLVGRASACEITPAASSYSIAPSTFKHKKHKRGVQTAPFCASAAPVSILQRASAASAYLGDRKSNLNLTGFVHEYRNQRKHKKHLTVVKGKAPLLSGKGAREEDNGRCRYIEPPGHETRDANCGNRRCARVRSGKSTQTKANSAGSSSKRRGWNTDMGKNAAKRSLLATGPIANMAPQPAQQFGNMIMRDNVCELPPRRSMLAWK